MNKDAQAARTQLQQALKNARALTLLQQYHVYMTLVSGAGSRSSRQGVA